MMLRPLVLLLTFIGACARPDHAPFAPTPGAVKLRVMTYNVNFGLAGDRAGVEAVASAAPDLVLFQETTPDWERALVDGLAATLPHHRFQHPAGRWAADGMGVMSRWPIRSMKTLEPAAGPFFAWLIVVDAPGGPVQVLNLHLRPPMSDSGSWVVGYFSTRGVREREAQERVRALEESLPTIITGDFNEEDSGRALAVFHGRGFTNVLPQFHPQVDTWHWRLSGGVTLKFRLDHVLVDRHFRALGAAVVPGGRSDHQPVWVDLERVL